MSISIGEVRLVTRVHSLLWIRWVAETRRGREAEESADQIRAALGANHDRLASIKAKYHPQNLFRHNQNIKPAR